MKKTTLVGLLSLLVLSAVAIAQESGEQRKDLPMQGMMQEMMKGEKTGEGGMGGMMEMMKMMDQFSAMMESMPTQSWQPKESQKK